VAIGYRCVTSARITRRDFAYLSVVVAITLSAAVSLQGASSLNSSASGAVVTQANGTPIKLMSIFEGTGPSASPEVPQGANAAAKAINAHGGIKGRPIDIVPCDTHNDPNVALECGRQAVAEGVVATVGDITIYGSEFMPLLAQNKIAAIGVQPATSADFTSPASFPISGGAPVQEAGLAESLASQGARKIAMARLDIAAAAPLVQFANAGLKHFHLKVAKDVPVPPGAPDMSPYVAAALQGGTDAVIVNQATQDAVNFVEALRQAKPTIRIAMDATGLGAVNRALGNNAQGIIEDDSDTLALDNSAVKQYDRDMKAAGYSDVTGFRLASYTSVLVFAKVARNLPTITSAAVFDALVHAKNINVGLTPPLQFSVGGVAGLPRVFSSCVLATRIKGGQQVPLTGKFQDAYTGKACPTSA